MNVPDLRNTSLTADSRDLQSAHRNGFWWELGNGLARVTLVTYLARELGADGFVVGLIVASPHLVGVFRLIAPWLIRRFANYQFFCIAFFIASSVTLMLLPVVCRPGWLPSRGSSLAALVTLWGGWHLLLYLGVVFLFAWFGELVPRAERGRFLGRREAWRMAGAIIGSVAAGLFALAWTTQQTKETHWLAYAIPAFCGGLVMWLSNVPLVDLPLPRVDDSAGKSAEDTAGSTVVNWQQLLSREPLRRFLLFACWGAFANGVTAAAVGLFAPVVLKIPALVVLALEAAMRVGQAAAAKPVGTLLDRYGNRSVLIAAQLLIACSLLVYLPAHRQATWWLGGVYLMYIAYVGLNIGLPRATLRLSSREDSVGVLALYYAATGLAVGLGAISGGIWFESLGRNWFWEIPAWGLKLDRFQTFFLIGFVLRLTAVIPLWTWNDPDAENATTIR